MDGRPEAVESKLNFRAHRNQRKSRLGKYNGNSDRPIHLPPAPCSFQPRKSLFGSRMNQVLYQEAFANRKKDALRNDPKKSLFAETSDENRYDVSFKIQRPDSRYVLQGCSSSSKEPEVTDIFRIQDQLKTKQSQFSFNSAPTPDQERQPLRDNNGRCATKSSKKTSFFLQDSNPYGDPSRRNPPPEQRISSWNWNSSVQSPVVPKLNCISSHLANATFKINVESPKAPELKVNSLIYSSKKNAGKEVVGCALQEPSLKPQKIEASSDKNEPNMELSNKEITISNVKKNGARLSINNDKKNRLDEKQKRISISEIKFEELCQLRNNGTMSFLSDSPSKVAVTKLSHNDEGERLSNVVGTSKVEEKDIVEVNFTRNQDVMKKIVKRTSKDNSNWNFHLNVDKPTILNSVELQSKMVYKQKQPHQIEEDKSPKFFIHKRNDTTVLIDNHDGDSFSNAYESSTLIVNEKHVNEPEEVDISNGLSNVQLNDVGVTFLVQKPHPSKMSVERELGSEMATNGSNFRNLCTASEVRRVSGTDLMNQSLEYDDTSTFIYNETLCNSNDLRLAGEVGVGKAETVTEEFQVVKSSVNALKNEEDDEIGVKRLEEVDSVDDGVESTNFNNCRKSSKKMLNFLENGLDKAAPVLSDDYKSIMEQHRLLLRRGEHLFNSRKRTMLQMKMLVETIFEQEKEFEGLNSEFSNLCQQFDGILPKHYQLMSSDATAVSNLKINNKQTTSLVTKPSYATPNSARHRRRNLVFSQLKSDFSCLKTPLPSTTKAQLESTANKTILTPRSMSVCIQDQVNQLFDS